MKISFHGAVGGQVTGSNCLVQANGKRILVDCGSFQEHNHGNSKVFGYEPSKIDAVLLSHAHLDHCGELPNLCKRGFKGEVITTAPSEELASLVMHDAAYLMQEEAARAKRHGKNIEPLYTEDDVEEVLRLFNSTQGPMSYGKPIEIAEGITVTAFDSGHMLGSASFLVELVEKGPTYKRLVFSGDIGNKNKPIVRDPIMPPHADFVIEESTYGNRNHKKISLSLEELYSVINETFERGGNVYMPTFAVEGSQENLFFLKKALEQKIIPEYTKVFLDSPMAISATKIFQRHPDFYNGEAKKLIENGEDPFIFPTLAFSRTPADSKAINDIKRGAIVMAGSGMCEGGRILHHMARDLSNPNSTFIFTRYAPPGTLARKIIDGAPMVKIFGEEFEIKARIVTINGFSGHAGKDGLIEWAEHTKEKGVPPEKLFLTHGSQIPMEALEKELTKRGFAVEMPEMHEQYRY